MPQPITNHALFALSQIARIETARLNTTIGTVYALLKALDADANELFQ